jgi:hypothetical protein
VEISVLTTCLLASSVTEAVFTAASTDDGRHPRALRCTDCAGMRAVRGQSGPRCLLPWQARPRCKPQLQPHLRPRARLRVRGPQREAVHGAEWRRHHPYRAPVSVCELSFVGVCEIHSLYTFHTHLSTNTFSWGSAYEMGFAQGQLRKEALREFYRGAYKYFEESAAEALISE